MTDQRIAENKPPSIAKCYASQHLRPQEYGAWEVSMRLTSGGANKLYFNGRTMARRFAATSKSGMYRIAEALTLAGWWVPLNGAGKKVSDATRRYKATEYQVLTHEQWTAAHGTSDCVSTPVPSTGMEPVPDVGTEPVPSTGMSSPTCGNVQSQNREIPVPPAGRSLVLSSVKESSVKENSKANVETMPSWPDWLPSESWLGFLRMRNRKRKSPTARAVRLIFEELDKLRSEGQDVAKVLDQSTRNSWTDVYPLKQVGAGKSRHASFADTDYSKGLDGFVVGVGQ